MRLCLITLISALAVAPAMANDFKSMTLATQLGSVLASEEICGLSFDQAAIAAFIEKSVRPDDLGFASTLQMMTSGQEFQLKGMSASAKTAHCTQTKRVAKSYGFIK